jgi:CDP-paratose 2-epimerase
VLNQTALVTGAGGLIGSEVSLYLSRHGFRVVGLDNNQRAVFFGPEGDTSWSRQRLQQNIAHYEHVDLDIRNRSGILDLLARIRPQVIVHTAAQPSHDRAAAIPFDDFDTNAVGTLNLLEGAHRSCPESPFVHMSTNKVYGDRPNTLPLREEKTRWEYADPAYENGIAETFSIDQSKHSLFGASKVASDVMVQEYGRYFNMPTCCLRGGCLTGPNHSGVELHGFLSYLIRCNVESLRLRRQAGSRQHPLRRCGRVHRAVCARPSRSGGVQHRRRPSQFLLHPGGLYSGGRVDGSTHAPQLLPRKPHRRPYLLLQ